MTTAPEPPPAPSSQSEMQSALFAQLVIQQAGMALMLMGRSPHPESGETIYDLEAARMFVETLEMIERKTQGNLSREEAALLKQQLMAVRLAFVEAVDAQPPQATESKSVASATTEPPAPPAPAKKSAAPEPDEDHRKKFSKKY